MKTVAKIALIAVAACLCGFFWDVMVWRFHIPYLAINWLGPLIGADGESAYDATMYEMMINFFIIFCLVWLIRWKFGKKTATRAA